MEVFMQTSLYNEHIAAGAKIIDYHGWKLPLQYGGILAEHSAVRNGAGIFDVSHMGEIYVEGSGALGFLQRLLTADMSRLETRPWVYSPMCCEDGGTIDDMIVYRYRQGYLLCVNAANTAKDLEHILKNVPADTEIRDISDELALIAVQGPEAASVIEKTDISAVLLKANTGYTGERGYELFLHPDGAPALWRALISAGAVPCGLGARDLLRTEAALPLYGHELGRQTDPLEAGLERFVCFQKGDFIGRDALLERRGRAGRRRLIGLTVQSRAVPRAGCAVFGDGLPCGTVTSGGVAPSVGHGIAMALVTGGAEAYTVEIRDKKEPASITDLPFYRRVR
jgi:aminomethyltransferase